MHNFLEAGLSPKILQAVAELGFENPTPIQKAVIPKLLSSDKDLIAQAQTGTGKTAAFGLPIIAKTDPKLYKTQALILCPTRELCMQITGDMNDFSKYTEDLKITAVFGGASMDKQIRLLKEGSQIVVGTPGRVLDLINRKKLIINNIKFLVLDEADEMLSMGFKDDLNAILADTPEEKQVLLFSATMSDEIKSIAKTYMKSPDEISVGNKNKGAENVEHYYYVVHAKDRYEALKRISDINPDIYGIIFCRTREETRLIAEKLMHDGYNADALHGDLSQAQRDNVMNRFRVKHLQLLVATDVAARGLDVTDLTHIINYDMPDEIGLYIHRSGRTGRAGKSGKSISIIHSRELSKIHILERQVGKKFERKMVPSGIEVCEKQLFKLIDKVENIEVNESQIEQFLPAVYKKLSWLDREELIKHFVSVEFNRFLAYYESAADLNTVPAGKIETKSDTGKNKRGRGTTFARFAISVGAKHKITPPRIIGIINERLQSREVNIGKIIIMDKFSIFDIDKDYQDEVIESFKGATFEKRALEIEQIDSRQNFERSSRSDRSNGTERRDSGERKRRR